GGERGRVAVEVHAVPADDLVAPLAVDVLRRLELANDPPADAGLLLDLAQRAALEALAVLELALGQRPVVVAGAVDHGDPPVAADDEPARRLHLRIGHRGADGIGSAARWDASSTSRSTPKTPSARSASTRRSSAGTRSTSAGRWTTGC